jgi:AcrR family transcriptional regulator
MESTAARLTFRQHVRDRALAAAYDLAIEVGWERVRLSEVATRAGTSRPTLYSEFGDKQGLGDALVLREAEQFLAGIEQVLQEPYLNAGEALASAVQYTLDKAAGSPLLKAVLTSPRLAASTEALSPPSPPVPASGVLPLISASAALLTTASERLVGWFAEHFRDADPADVDAATDAIVRLTVSHLVVPAYDSRETSLRVSEIATRYLAA